MHILRRYFLSSIIAAVLTLWTAADAEAAHRGTRVSGGGGALITTLTIQNTSGSTQAANFVTPMFGHPFKKGDIANGCSGGAPIFKRHANNAVMPFSEGLAPICWFDGSLKFAPFMLQDPASIAGSGTDAVDIYSGGTTPSASSRTLADAASGSTDLNFSVAGLATLGNLSAGPWVSDLNQGVSAAKADNYTYADGGAGKVVRVRASYRFSGADHGQMEGYWYLQLLNDGSGAFGGMRYLHRIAQPWYNNDTPAKNYRAFSAMTLNNGVSLVRDMFTGHFGVGKAFNYNGVVTRINVTNGGSGYAVAPTVSFTGGSGSGAGGATANVNAGVVISVDLPSGGTGTGYTTALPNVVFTPVSGGSGAAATAQAQVFTATSTSNFDTSFLIGFTTSGSLQTGLSTGTSYFANPVNSTDFQVTTNPQTAIDGSAGFLSASGTCTGTCTATAYPYLPMFTSMYSAGTTGKYDYIQAGGSVAADSTVRIAFNNTYWRSTKLVPPYLIGTITPTNTTATTYYPLSAGPLLRNVGQTGERSDIGLFTDWAATHFYNQDAPDEQNIRVMALVSGGMAVDLRNNSTFTIPVVNNTTYTGMPAHNTTFGWRAQPNTASGFTQPTDLNVLNAGFTSPDFSHLAETEYYALMTTGEPQDNDALVSFANQGIVYHPGVNPAMNAIVNGATNAMGGISNNGPSQRNFNIGGTAFWGGNSGFDNGTRPQAWTNRTIAMADAIGGGYEPAGAATRQYITDIDHTIYAADLAYIALLPANVQTEGMWTEADFGGTAHEANWQHGYLQQATAFAAGALEDANIQLFGTHLGKFQTWIDTNFSVWAIPHYNSYVRTGVVTPPTGNGNYNPYITTTTGFAVCPGWDGTNGMTFSWTNGSPTFTMTHTIGGYAVTNNDTALWGVVDANEDAPPTGSFSTFTPYYMVGVSGTSFGLSATQGGGTISPTNTQTDQRICIANIGHPTAGNIAGGGTGSGYMQNITGSQNFLSAAGATVDATALGHMNTNLHAQPGYISNGNLNPKYTYGPNY